MRSILAITYTTMDKLHNNSMNAFGNNSFSEYRSIKSGMNNSINNSINNSLHHSVNSLTIPSIPRQESKWIKYDYECK